MITPLINGVNYSWANITLILFGVPVVGITKISYKRAQKKENNYGMGAQPVSRGYGNYEYGGSIELYLDEWNRIIAASPNRDPFQIGPFDVPITFGGNGVQATKHVLRAVEFTEDNFDSSQGDTKIMITVPLVIGAIDK
jgi:hypothetical protein